MKAFIIATGVSNKKILKYRLLRIPEDDNYTAKNNFEVMDVEAFKLKQAMELNKIEIVNAKLQGDTIVGNGARLTRYTQISMANNRPIGAATIVILKQLVMNGNNVGYVISDFTGKVLNKEVNDIIEYTKICGIANGKVITRGGKKYISSIQDSYDETDITLVNKNTKAAKTPIKSIREEKSEMSPEVDRLSIENKNDSEQKLDWTIAEFEKYMDEHDYDFNIKDSELIFADSRMKFLSIPLGVTRITKISRITSVVAPSYHTNHIEKIYLPKTITYTDTFSFCHLSSLKEIVLSDDFEEFDFTSVQRTGAKFNIPKGLKKIYWHNNSHDRWEPSDADYSKAPKLAHMIGCNVSARLQNVDLGSIKIISNSFNNIDIIGGKLVIGPNVEEIDHSFKTVDVDEIDFSNAVNLRKIGDNCFYHFIVKKMDLSKCTKLTHIGSECFVRMPYLEEIILPDSVKQIGTGCFEDCPKLKKN